MEYRSLFQVMCLCIFVLLARECAPQENAYSLHLASIVVSDQRFVGFEDSQKLVFQAKDGKSLTVSASSMARWGAWRPPHGDSAVWLSDGSWIVGRVAVKGSQTLVLDSDWFQAVEIPMNLCRGLVSAPPFTVTGWYQFERQLRAASGDRDFIWLADGQQQTGVLKWLDNGSNEITNEAAETIFSLESTVQARKFGLDEIQAIVFCPSLHPPLLAGQPVLSLGLRDGSLLAVRSFQRTADNRLLIGLSLPVRLETLDQHSRFARAIDYLAGSPPNVTWLSDLEPARFRHATQSSITWPLGRDRDLFDRPLLLNGNIVSKGLAMHSAAQATYRWNGKPAKFLSEVVLAEAPEAIDVDLGSVDCQVLLARDGKLQTVFTAPTLRRQSPPLSIDVDITGAQLVVLLTDMADVGQFGDHALWLDARFAKTE